MCKVCGHNHRGNEPHKIDDSEPVNKSVNKRANKAESVNNKVNSVNNPVNKGQPVNVNTQCQGCAAKDKIIADMRAEIEGLQSGKSRQEYMREYMAKYRAKQKAL